MIRISIDANDALILKQLTNSYIDNMASNNCYLIIRKFHETLFEY